LEKHVSDLEALRQHFGLECMTLLGHSSGGIVAGAYAVAHPDRVERMLLVEPAVPASSFLTGVTQRDRALKERIGPAAGARADNLPDAIAVAPDPVAMCKEFFQDLGSPVFFRTVAAASRSRGEFCTPADALRNIATVAKFSYGAAINPSWDLRPHLRAVRAPTLVVYGEESVLGIEPMEGWATALPNARLFGIPDAQHYPHVDRPELFFPAAETFLSGTWPDAARDPHR
jgi:proline iminopeptidase